MDLKLEVKKLEKRETKNNDTTPYSWCVGFNADAIGEIMSGCTGGCSSCGC